MVAVELSKIIIDEKRQDQIIVLKEKAGDRQFPIVIGFLEASSIQMRIAGVAASRPLTHDLILTMIKTVDAQMESLVIDKMIENTFHAKIYLRLKDGITKIIDCRPSDGIALAVRTEAPIFVDDDVMQHAVVFK
ncbi:MAG: bifunctional nuclease family protein [Candidatus Omnitrophica bacterium]|nr:bifunctional nuclease family protein [Candidatus Omnitrophota bacterium]